MPTSTCKFKDEEVDFDYDVFYEVEVSLELEGAKLNSWKEKLTANQTQFATDSLSYVRKYLP